MALKQYEPCDLRPRGAYVAIRSQGTLAISPEAVKQSGINEGDRLILGIDADETPKILVVRLDPGGRLEANLGKDGGLTFHVPKFIESENLRRGNWKAVCDLGEVMVELTVEGESGGEEKPKRIIVRKPKTPAPTEVTQEQLPGNE